VDSRKYRAKYQKKLYHKRKENHQCVCCGQKLEEKYKLVLCEKCNERNKMYHKNYYENCKRKEIIFAKIKIALSKATGIKREDQP